LSGDHQHDCRRPIARVDQTIDHAMAVDPAGSAAQTERARGKDDAPGSLR
jgi:hypothetical protein